MPESSSEISMTSGRPKGSGDCSGDEGELEEEPGQAPTIGGSSGAITKVTSSSRFPSGDADRLDERSMSSSSRSRGITCAGSKNDSSTSQGGVSGESCRETWIGGRRL